MPLELYNKKRNFGITPEPKGRVVKRKAKGLMFVIQMHRASHLHYDFRLELNGVLLSWAVPKGPSLDTSVRRLAMHVEDHPIEYGDFEGTIPPRQYGAGTVMVWDRGVWIPRGDPVRDYKQGRLKFNLEGEKLGGGWMLVRGSASGKYGENAWFLIKEKDEYAKPESAGAIVEEEPDSVASGRSLDEIAADADRVWHSNKSVAENVAQGAVKTKKARAPDLARVAGAIKSEMPDLIEPELATLVKQPPSGDEWVHELKLDGYRMLCRIEKGVARFISRSGRDWTASFPSIARSAARLPVKTAWLDGEVVVMDDQGRTSFQGLQNVLANTQATGLHYVAFDLMHLNGHDLTQAPLTVRKRLLESLLTSAPAGLRYSSHIAGSGEEFFRQACKLKLEGMIAKRAQSTYQSGRTRDWLKVKCGMRQEMVIGGYTDARGTRSGFGALLLGVYEPDGTLRYSGKVGTGFNDATLKRLHKQLAALEIKTAPFSNPPRGYEAKGAHWVQPQLVAEVEFTEWTNEGTLRHPSFQGLRADKQAKDVVRERPEPLEADEKSEASPEEGVSKVKAPSKTAKRATGTAKRSEASSPAGTVAGVNLSNPDKVLYPEARLTKCDLARYYEQIGEWILPHLRNRPLTLVRCPNGWNKQCFYQKHPDAKVNPLIERVTVEESNGPTLYMMANSVPAIVALLQMGALELHPFGSSAPKLHCPDRVIFDFDPDDSISWAVLVEAVHLLKTLLEELGLKPFIKTTGGKGLHVVIPVKPNFGWDEIKPFTKAIAELLEQSFPDRFVSNMSKAKRRGKIFVDYLRNGEGATAIAAYSLRAREGAPVATPIEWEELAQDVRRDYFNVRNVPERLRRMKRDPWADFFTIKQSVTRAMMKKVGLR